MVKEGYAILDENGPKGYDDRWKEASMDGLDKNPDLEEVFKK